MSVFNFQERGGLASVLNKFFCALVFAYRNNPSIFFDHIIVGGLFTNLGLVNTKNHNLYPDILKTCPELFEANLPVLSNEFVIDGFGIKNYEQIFTDPACLMILNTYFNFSDSVFFESERIMKEQGIDPGRTLFVWARKTDKGTECVLPSAEEYKMIIEKNNLQKLEVILQTDDVSVYEDFTRAGIPYRTLDVLPASSGEKGFHLSDGCLSEGEFQKKHGMSKVEYNIRFMALVRIATLSRAVILAPGNLVCFIPMMRRNMFGVYTPPIRSFVQKEEKHLLTHGILGAEKIPLPGEQKRKVLYIGNLSDSENIATILSCQIPDSIDLIFIGERASANPKVFEALLEKATLPNIHYFGAFYGNEYRNVLYSSDAVIIPPLQRNNKKLIYEALVSENSMIIPGGTPLPSIPLPLQSTRESIERALHIFASLSDEEVWQMKENAGIFAYTYDWR